MRSGARFVLLLSVVVFGAVCALAVAASGPRTEPALAATCSDYPNQAAAKARRHPGSGRAPPAHLTAATRPARRPTAGGARRPVTADRGDVSGLCRPGGHGSLELTRRPQERREDHRGETDDEADDPAGDILAHEHRTQRHSDADDATGGDQAHEAALDLGAAPVSAGDHSLGPLAAPGLTLVMPRPARGRVGVGFDGSPLCGRGTLARL
jgi:hypothetical protein